MKSLRAFQLGRRKISADRCKKQPAPAAGEGSAPAQPHTVLPKGAGLQAGAGTERGRRLGSSRPPGAAPAGSSPPSQAAIGPQEPRNAPGAGGRARAAIPGPARLPAGSRCPAPPGLARCCSRLPAGVPRGPVPQQVEPPPPHSPLRHGPRGRASTARLCPHGAGRETRARAPPRPDPRPLPGSLCWGLRDPTGPGRGAAGRCGARGPRGAPGGGSGRSAARPGSARPRGARAEGLPMSYGTRRPRLCFKTKLRS